MKIIVDLIDGVGRFKCGPSRVFLLTRLIQAGVNHRHQALAHIPRAYYNGPNLAPPIASQVCEHFLLEISHIFSNTIKTSDIELGGKILSDDVCIARSRFPTIIGMRIRCSGHGRSEISLNLARVRMELE